MAAVETPPKEIDRKLYEIFKSTRPNIKAADDLAEAVRRKKPLAFLYVRKGKEVMAGEETIERYIGFAVVISLLNAKLQPTRGKKTVRSLQAFQNWLGDKAQIYLDNNGCSAYDIHRVTRDLVRAQVPTLPTDKNVYQALGPPIELGYFRFATRIMSIFKPKDYIVRSRPVFLFDGILTE
jgi:hypothetical protein